MENRWTNRRWLALTLSVISARGLAVVGPTAVKACFIASIVGPP